MEDWEQSNDNQNGRGGLNPHAKPFTLNPAAASFVPSFVPQDGPSETSQPPKVTSLDAAPPQNDDPSDGQVAQPAQETAQQEEVEAVTQATAEISIEDSGPPQQPNVQEQADTREHLNIVFIGHVDAGKSTLGGQILFQTGNVDERTIQKYEKEAKDKNRESWYMAYIMDTNDEEREKGKTVEVGRAHFNTEKKRYTILDAPGHKNYVPNMILGTSQADVGVLVIAARKGEFETGFERGGQTREHTQLAKTLGVSKLVVVVNKMDDPSIIEPNGQWSKRRFDEVESRLSPFLKTCGYAKKDVLFLPISGLLGKNILAPVPEEDCPWWSKGSLLYVLDNLDPVDRDPNAAFRMSIFDKYRDMGTVVMGKSESGTVNVGDNLILMPNRVKVKVEAIFRDEVEVRSALPGENLRLKLSGVEETDISPGFVLSSPDDLVPTVRQFEAQLMVLELMKDKSIFTAGYKAILHIHSAVEECEVTKLVAEIDMKKNAQKKVTFVKSNSMVVCRIGVERNICVEEFKKSPQLGRFTLRDEGQTIAIGKITKLPKSKPN